MRREILAIGLAALLAGCATAQNNVPTSPKLGLFQGAYEIGDKTIIYGPGPDSNILKVYTHGK